MHPILFTLPSFQFLSHEWGPFTLNSYGLMMALSFALSLPLLARDTGRLLAPKVGIRASEGFQKTWDMFVWVILSSLFGGRLFYVLENHEEFEGQWLDAFKLWQGGLVFYGGLLGALVAAWLWMRREKWPVVFFFDIAAPYILLGHAIARGWWTTDAAWSSRERGMDCRGCRRNSGRWSATSSCSSCSSGPGERSCDAPGSRSPSMA